MNTIAKLQQNFEHAYLELDPNKILFAPNHEGIIVYEFWKDIPEYEGLYQASNIGRIKSLERKVNHRYGCRVVKEIIRKQNKNKGYLCIKLSKNNKSKGFEIHQLIAMSFLGHKPSRFIIVVDHKDNIKINNFDWNLQLISQRKNSSKDQFRHNNSSKHIGVYWGKKFKKWGSRIRHKTNSINLGHFTNQKEASKYYQDALKAIQNGTEIKTKRAVFSSKYKGVSKTGKKWLSQIIHDKKRLFLGSFDTEEEASEYYENALLSIANKQEIKIKKTVYSSKYKGVSWCKSKNKWRCYIFTEGIRKNVGSFNTEQEAYLAVQKELNKL